MPQKSHSEQTPIWDDFGFFTNKKRNQGNQAIEDAGPFKSSLSVMISFQNFKIKPQKKVKLKAKARSDHSCALLIPSTLMDCSLSHPACHILSFLNFLLAWKWIISHHFKRVLPGLPGKTVDCVYIFRILPCRKFAAPHL